MKSLDQTYQNEIIIKNSRFICIFEPLKNSNIEDLMDKIKLQFPKATHYCYAYIYDDLKHSSDDGEPGGTAGMPILNVLEKEEYNRVLCVVVRYFGGIKLGAGGLVRAYTKSVTEAIKNISTHELIPGYEIKLEFPYEEEKNVLYILQQSPITSREYLETISYTCFVSEEIYEKLSKYQPTILQKSYIKKDL